MSFESLRPMPVASRIVLMRAILLRTFWWATRTTGVALAGIGAGRVSRFLNRIPNGMACLLLFIECN